jgi:lipopolysaccharide exporter
MTTADGDATSDATADTRTPPGSPFHDDGHETEEALEVLEADHDLAGTVGRGAVWAALAGVIVQGTTLSQAVILRLPGFLTAEQFGVFATAYAVAFIGFQLRDLSLGLKYVQDTERDERDAFNVAFTLETLLGLIGATAIVLAAPVLGWLYGDREITLVALGLAPFAFAGMLALPEYILTRELRFRTKAVRMMLTAVVTLGVTLLAAWNGYGAWSLVIGSWTNLALLLLTLWPVVRRVPRFRWDREANRSYLSFGWPLWAASLCLGLFNLAVIAAVGIIFDDLVIVSYYALVWSIIEVSYKINLQLTMTLYPAICRMGTEIQRLRRTFTAVNRLTMTVSAPIGAVLVFFGPDLVRVLDESYWGAGPYLQAVGSFFVLGTLAFDWEDYYRARGNTKPLFLIALWLLAFLPFYVTLVAVFGVPGIWASIVMTGIYLYVIRSIYVRRLLGDVSAVRAAWVQIVAAAGCGAVGWGVRTALGGGVGPMVVGVAVGGVCYAALMTAFQRRLVTFGLNVLRRRPTGGLAALLDG